MKTIFGLFLAGLFLLSGLMVLDSPREPVVYHKKQVLVYSGDTLWGIASQAAGPEEDVRAVLDRITQANHLDLHQALQPGQVLVVPVRAEAGEKGQLASRP